MEEKRTRKPNRSKAQLRENLVEKINHHKELADRYEKQLQELDLSIENEYREIVEAMNASGKTIEHQSELSATA